MKKQSILLVMLSLSSLFLSGCSSQELTGNTVSTGNSNVSQEAISIVEEDQKNANTKALQEKTYETYQNDLNNISKETYTEAQVSKTQQLLKDYSKEIISWAEDDKLPIFYKTTIEDTVIKIYGSLFQNSPNGDANVCGSMVGPNGYTPGYPFCIGVVTNGESKVIVPLIRKDRFENNIFLQIIKDKQKNISSKKSLIITEAVYGDSCESGISRFMFDKSLNYLGDLSSGGYDCEGGAGKSITKSLYKDSKKIKGSIGANIRYPNNITNTNEGLRNYYLNSKEDVVLSNLFTFNELVDLNINTGDTLYAKIGNKEINTKLEDITKTEEKTYLSLTLTMSSENNYQIIGNTYGSDKISKVTIESCTASNNNILDGKAYTIKGLSGPNEENQYNFSYNISNKLNNICKSPYIIRLYDNQGVELEKYAYDLLLPQVCIKERSGDWICKKK